MQDSKEWLIQASQLAASGRFAQCVTVCVQAMQGADAFSLLDIGALLSSYGFLSDARACYEKAHALAPADLRIKGVRVI